MTSFVSYVRALACVLAAFLHEIYFDMPECNVAKYLPTHASAKNLLTMNYAEILFVIYKKSTNTKLFYTSDDANKGMYHLIDIVYFFSLTDMKLFRQNIDSDACVGTNAKSAEHIDYIIRKLDSTNSDRIKNYSGAADVGCGRGGYHSCYQ